MNNQRYFYETESYTQDDGTMGYQWVMDSDDLAREQTFSDYIISHTSGMNMASKILKYFNVTPNLSLKSDWVNRSFSGFIDSTGKINKNEVLGFSSRTTGSFSLNMNTQVYGLFPIKLGNIQAIRHVVSPSIGYSYRPDFSKEVFGSNPEYYQAIKQDNGEVVYFDRFAGTLAGGTPRAVSYTHLTLPTTPYV